MKRVADFRIDRSQSVGARACSTLLIFCVLFVAAVAFCLSDVRADRSQQPVGQPEFSRKFFSADTSSSANSIKDVYIARSSIDNTAVVVGEYTVPYNQASNDQQVYLGSGCVFSHNAYTTTSSFGVFIKKISLDDGKCLWSSVATPKLLLDDDVDINVYFNDATRSLLVNENTGDIYASFLITPNSYTLNDITIGFGGACGDLIVPKSSQERVIVASYDGHSGQCLWAYLLPNSYSYFPALSIDPNDGNLLVSAIAKFDSSVAFGQIGTTFSLGGSCGTVGDTQDSLFLVMYRLNSTRGVCTKFNKILQSTSPVLSGMLMDAEKQQVMVFGYMASYTVLPSTLPVACQKTILYNNMFVMSLDISNMTCKWVYTVDNTAGGNTMAKAMTLDPLNPQQLLLAGSLIGSPSNLGTSCGIAPIDQGAFIAKIDRQTGQCTKAQAIGKTSFNSFGLAVTRAGIPYMLLSMTVATPLNLVSLTGPLITAKSDDSAIVAFDNALSKVIAAASVNSTQQVYSFGLTLDKAEEPIIAGFMFGYAIMFNEANPVVKGDSSTDGFTTSVGLCPQGQHLDTGGCVLLPMLNMYPRLRASQQFRFNPWLLGKGFNPPVCEQKEAHLADGSYYGFYLCQTASVTYRFGPASQYCEVDLSGIENVAYILVSYNKDGGCVWTRLFKTQGIQGNGMAVPSIAADPWTGDVVVPFNFDVEQDMFIETGSYSTCTGTILGTQLDSTARHLASAVFRYNSTGSCIWYTLVTPVDLTGSVNKHQLSMSHAVAFAQGQGDVFTAFFSFADDGDASYSVSYSHPSAGKSVMYQPAQVGDKMYSMLRLNYRTGAIVWHKQISFSGDAKDLQVVSLNNAAGIIRALVYIYGDSTYAYPFCGDPLYPIGTSYAVWSLAENTGDCSGSTFTLGQYESPKLTYYDMVLLSPRELVAIGTVEANGDPLSLSGQCGSISLLYSSNPYSQIHTLIVKYDPTTGTCLAWNTIFGSEAPAIQLYQLVASVRAGPASLLVASGYDSAEAAGDRFCARSAAPTPLNIPSTIGNVNVVITFDARLACVSGEIYGSSSGSFYLSELAGVNNGSLQISKVFGTMTSFFSDTDNIYPGDILTPLVSGLVSPQCGPGYQVNSKTWICDACPINTYSDRVGQPCKPCPFGSFTLGIASQTCQINKGVATSSVFTFMASNVQSVEFYGSVDIPSQSSEIIFGSYSMSSGQLNIDQCGIFASNLPSVPFIMKLDSSGKCQWFTIIDGTESVSFIRTGTMQKPGQDAIAFLADQPELVFIAGSFVGAPGGSLIFGGGCLDVEAMVSEQRYFMASYDISTGQCVWTRMFSANRIGSITAYATGASFAVAGILSPTSTTALDDSKEMGSTCGTLTKSSNMGVNDKDSIIFQLDPTNGFCVWAQRIGGNYFALEHVVGVNGAVIATASALGRVDPIESATSNCVLPALTSNYATVVMRFFADNGTCEIARFSTGAQLAQPLWSLYAKQDSLVITGQYVKNFVYDNCAISNEGVSTYLMHLGASDLRCRSAIGFVGISYSAVATAFGPEQNIAVALSTNADTVKMSNLACQPLKRFGSSTSTNLFFAALSSDLKTCIFQSFSGVAGATTSEYVYGMIGVDTELKLSGSFQYVQSENDLIVDTPLLQLPLNGDAFRLRMTRACVAGTFTPDNNNCFLCTPGYYGQFAAYTATNCMQCGENQFSTTMGATSCQDCPYATGSVPGSTSCPLIIPSIPKAITNLTVSFNSKITTLTWSPPVLTGNGGPLLYAVTLYIANGYSWDVVQDLPNHGNTSISFSSLTAGTYQAIVIPHNNIGYADETQQLLFNVSAVCYGRTNYNFDVCNGNGTCVGTDVCSCAGGFAGARCQISCDAGYFSPTNTIGDFCQPCPLGSYNPYPKQPGCLACQPGKVALHNASVSCSSCPLSTPFPSEDSTQCLLCPNSKDAMSLSLIQGQDDTGILFQFNNDLTLLTAYVKVTNAGQLYSRRPPPFQIPCTTLFASSSDALALGAGAQCTVLQAESFAALSVTLGTRPKLLPTSTLHVNALALENDRQAFLPKSCAISGFVQKPPQAPAPLVVISAPAVFSTSCASGSDTVLRLSAVRSQPSDAVSIVVQYDWSLDPNSDGFNSTAIHDYLQTVSKASPVVDLPRWLFRQDTTVDDVYIFNVFVTTNYDGTASATVTVRRSEISKPMVSIDSASSVLQVTRSMPVRLQSRVSFLSECNVTDIQVRYQWYQLDGASVLDSTFVRTNRSFLYIPRYTLPASNTPITFQVTAFDAKGNNASATIQVLVVQQPLSAIITGGNRQQSYRASIALDASSSVDPDLDSSVTASYAWNCWKDGETTDSPFSVPCQQLLIGVADKPSFSFVDHGLPADTTWYFQVTYSKGLRSSTTKAYVSLLQTDPPVVQIMRQGSSPELYVNSNEQVVLTSNVKLPSSSLTIQRYEWYSSQIVSSDIDSSDFNQPNLVIKPNALRAGSTLSLSLRVTASNGAIGVSQVTITVNSPPSGGSLIASTPKGIAGETVFRFDALGWSDADQPLLYSFYATKGNKQFVLVEESVNSFAEVILPTGDPSSNYSLGIVMRISDSRGASSWMKVTVTVENPPVVSTSESSKLAYIAATIDSTLNNMIAEAIVDEANQMMLVLLDHLSSSGPGKQTRKEIRKHLTNLLSDLMDNTSFTEQSWQVILQQLQLVQLLGQYSSESDADGQQQLMQLTQRLLSRPELYSLDASRTSDIYSTAIQNYANALTLKSLAYQSLREMALRLLNQTAVGQSAFNFDTTGNTEQYFQIIGRRLLAAAFSMQRIAFDNAFDFPTTVLQQLGIGNAAAVDVMLLRSQVNPYAMYLSSHNVSMNHSIVSLSLLQNGFNLGIRNLPEPIKVTVPGFFDPLLVSTLTSNASEATARNMTLDLIQCAYWSEKNATWQTDGCFVSSFDARTGKVICACSHLTDFAVLLSKIIPKFNTLDDSVLKPPSKENIVITVFMAVFLALYVILFALCLLSDFFYSSVSKLMYASTDDKAMVKAEDMGGFRQMLESIKVSAVFFSLIFRSYKETHVTRTSRITVIFCIIMTTMASNAIFYNITQETPIQMFVVALFSVALTMPFSTVIRFILRKVDGSWPKLFKKVRRRMYEEDQKPQRLVELSPLSPPSAQLEKSEGSTVQAHQHQHTQSIMLDAVNLSESIVDLKQHREAQAPDIVVKPVETMPVPEIIPSLSINTEPVPAEHGSALGISHASPSRKSLRVDTLIEKESIVSRALARSMVFQPNILEKISASPSSATPLVGKKHQDDQVMVSPGDIELKETPASAATSSVAFVQPSENEMASLNELESADMMQFLMDSPAFQQAIHNSFLVSPGREVQRLVRNMFGHDELRSRIQARRRRRDTRLKQYELLIDRSPSIITKLYLRWSEMEDRLDDWADSGIVFFSQFMPEPLKGLSIKFILAFLVLSILYFGVITGFIVLMELVLARLWLKEFSVTVGAGSILLYFLALLFFYKKGKDFQFSAKPTVVKIVDSGANDTVAGSQYQQLQDDDTFAGMPRYTAIKSWQVSKKLVVVLSLLLLLSIALFVADFIIIMTDVGIRADTGKMEEDVLKLYTLPMNWYYFHTVMLFGSAVLALIFGTWISLAILPPAGYIQRKKQRVQKPRPEWMDTIFKTVHHYRWLTLFVIYPLMWTYIIGMSVLLYFYGTKFGNDVALQWIRTVVVALVINILIKEPLSISARVFLSSLFLSMIQAFLYM